MRRRIRVWLQRREIDRSIPSSYNWYMRDGERMMWRRYGWRVKYWVCTECGARREGYPMQYLGAGWMLPARTCECGT